MKTTFLLTVLTAVCLTACNFEPSADEIQQKQIETSMREANNQVGMPAIVNYQEKKFVKEIYELRDQENIICYAYLVNVMNGKIGQFLGKCVGYGLPYSTQFSNPKKVVHENDYNGGSFGTLPQSEPNGLFVPEGLSATWLRLIDPKTGNTHVVYVEAEIIVSPIKLH